MTETKLQPGAIYDYIQASIKGRMALTKNTATLLARAVATAPGDHLEIGSLFGGSAILAAIVKEQMDHPGLIYCVDPLTGYYTRPKDPTTQLPINLETFNENIKKFGVAHRIRLVQAKSLPMPKDLLGMTWATIFLDGDHGGNTPTEEVLRYGYRANEFLILDNYQEQFPAVISATIQAQQLGWMIAEISENLIVLRKERHE